MIARTAILLLFLAVVSPPARAQKDGGVSSVASRFLLPSEIGEVRALRRVIVALGDSLPPVRAVQAARIDRIYCEAVRIAEGDPMRALFLCSIATLPYWEFPAVVPLAGWVIMVPVSTETHEEFLARLAALPSLVLRDSKAGEDRDKLTHFFGSAWLACKLRSVPLVNLIGMLVEIGERLFKLEGAEDPRDLDAGRLGAAFGLALGRDADALPSFVLCSEASPK